MIRVVILGSGNVATHLYRAFYFAENVTVIQHFNRRGILIHADQQQSEVTDQINALVDADIYIIAVSDDAIAELSEKLPFSNKLVVHTSGSIPMDSLSNKNRKGVFYPLQTFSKAIEIDFVKIPICIEAEAKGDQKLLDKLARYLSNNIYSITSDQRSKLHLAAVFANNFTNYMCQIGKNICDEHKIPFEILHPLIQETATKILKTNPKEAQTGPAVRNDVETIHKHLDTLTSNTQKEIYKLLTKSIQSDYGEKL